MQYHLACISTNEGGIPEIIDNGKTGYTVAKRSAEALAEKISYCIYHQDKCIAMGEAGYEKYLQEFTLVKFELRMKDILKECL